MGGYIGATAVGLTTTAADVQGDITSTDTTPEVILKNTTETDADGSRDGKITFKGEQSGGEESTLAQIQSSHDGTSDDQKGDLIFRTNDGSDGASPTEALRITSAQKIGIGTNDPTGNVEIATSASDTGVDLVLDGNKSSNGGVGSIIFNNAGDSVGMIRSNRASANDAADMLFYTQATGGANSERMRITNDGNLLVGTTDANPGNNSGGSDVGSVLDVNGKILGTANAAEVMVLNRQSSFGTIAEFRKDGTTMGTIGSGFGGELFIAASGTNSSGLLLSESNQVRPMKNGSTSDNTQDIGVGNGRFNDAFITNGVTTGSDQTEKQQIQTLTDAEIAAAKRMSAGFKTFKWNDAVAAKGDNARTHTGVIAQELRTSLEAEGLDAGNYAFFMSDTWWEKDVEVAAVEANEEEGREAADAYTRTDTYSTKDAAPSDATERTRLGVRYPELLSFIGAATEQRLTSIESRLTALEAG